MSLAAGRERSRATAGSSDGQGAACRLLGVSKRFSGVWACRDVDLSVLAGEVHTVLGENGAGKSTLMKMLHGLHQPDEGHLEVDGREVAFASPRDAETAGIAMIPQELDLFPDLSVAENLFVGRTRPRRGLGAFNWPAMRREAETVFRTLDMDIDVNAPARSLSGANAQMVEIARALVRDARVVLMDEPTAALTEREAQRLFGIIRDLTARGVGVVYISHRLEEVFEIADRVTVMRDGARIHTGPASALDLQSLVRMMVGRPLQKLFHHTPRTPGQPLLEVRGLGRADAFKDVSFDLRAGEILGLSGLIGAGRSEVAQTIFGIHAPSSGEVRVRGQRVRPGDPRAALASGITYVPEERRSQGLLLDFAVDWNISFSILDRLSRLGWVLRRRERTTAEEFRSRLAIRCDGLDSPVSALSGGNQQKVLLSKSLVLRPDVILLDEPTRGVDVGAKAEIYRIIDDLAGAGKAILMISSEMNELLSMADRILVMYQGRVSGEFDGPDFAVDQIGAAATGLTRPAAHLEHAKAAG